MTAPVFKQSCSCPCGESTFQVRARPFARFFCHCSICQKLYKQAFADVTVLWWRNIVLPETQNIQFKKYRSFPAIERGVCLNCDSPIVASLGLGPTRLALTSAGNFSEISELDEAKMHIFYNRRVRESTDDLPKYSGYMRSQLAVARLMTNGLFRFNS